MATHRYISWIIVILFLIALSLVLAYCTVQGAS